MNADDFVIRVLAAYESMDDYEKGVFWRVKDREPGDFYFGAMCNDFFWWGTGDCEQITPENVEVLEQCITDVKRVSGESWPWYLYQASLLFCARVRQMRPQGAYYKHLDPTIWHLFDACGPDRAAQLGNPYDRPEDPSKVQAEDAEITP